MADRVFLILSDTSAAMVEEVLRSRIVKIDDAEWGQNLNAQQEGWRAKERLERAHLSNVVGQLMAPT